MDPHFDGVIFKTHTAELRRRLSRPFPPFCVVDVRWRGDYDRGHIPGALNALPESLKSLPPGATPHTEILAKPGDIAGGVRPWTSGERYRDANSPFELSMRRAICGDCNICKMQSSIVFLAERSQNDQCFQ